MEEQVVLARKLAAILPHLNERQRRVVLAAEARARGRGGITQVARAAQVSRTTVHTALAELDAAVRTQGHQVSYRTVARLLQHLEYSLQAPRKVLEGGAHPDRAAQFDYLNGQVTAALAAGQPVVSVDAKKKELVGTYKNGGQEWQPQGQPERVNVYDFVDKQVGKAIPYGIHDVGRKAGRAHVGQDHDTAQFAIESLRRWWQSVGLLAYPQAHRLLIC